MKLNYKYTIAYAIVTFVVLVIGFSIVYTTIRRSAVQSAAGKLEHLNNLVAGELEKDSAYPYHPSVKNIKIALADHIDTAKDYQQVSVRKEWSDDLQAQVSTVHFSSFPVIHNKRYRITSKTILIEPEDIYLNGIILVFAWTFVFLLALVIILSEVISWYILKPFYDTLEAIQYFRLSQDSVIAVHDTQTSEFRELNDFLVKMTSKAKGDYTALKEFSENASHELQTPIATMTAKIELLMQTPLAEDQVATLASLHDELERLAKINQSLTLLAKLENYEYDQQEKIDFSEALMQTINRYADWMEMKFITVDSKIEKKVEIALDEALCGLLLNNLISNAIRHNIPNGRLSVTLSAERLILKNTGEPPLIPVTEVFGRFRKGNQAVDSIGIGLAIVKKICDLYGHSISYAYADGWHTMQIDFLPVPKISNPL